MTETLIGILTEEGSIHPIVLSLKAAAITVLLHLFFGVGFGYVLSKETVRFRGVLDAAITLPLIFPPIATGFVLLLILGRNGVFGSALEKVGVEVIFSQTGVFVAAFISGLPLVVKPVQSAIESMGKTLREASYALGKSELTTFLKVVLPNIKKVILAGLVLSLGRSFGEVGITLMLGGNIIGKTETVSLAIYNAVFEGNFEKAMILSALLAALSLGIFYSLKKLSNL